MFRRDQAMTVMENLLQTFQKVEAVIASTTRWLWGP